MTVNDLVDRLTNCSITYLPQAVHWSSLEQVHQDAPGGPLGHFHFHFPDSKLKRRTINHTKLWHRIQFH